MLEKLNHSPKKLMILEAGFVYCLRHELCYNSFMDDVFMSEDFDLSDGSEFNNICEDLRFFRHSDFYQLKELTVLEYEKCLAKFN